MKKEKQPDDPGSFPFIDDIKDIKEAGMQYKTRWTVYHTLLVIGVWGIWLCTMYALRYGWGSL